MSDLHLRMSDIGCLHLQRGNNHFTLLLHTSLLPPHLIAALLAVGTSQCCLQMLTACSIHDSRRSSMRSQLPQDCTSTRVPCRRRLLVVLPCHLNLICNTQSSHPLKCPALCAPCRQNGQHSGVLQPMLTLHHTQSGSPPCNPLPFCGPLFSSMHTHACYTCNTQQPTPQLLT